MSKYDQFLIYDFKLDKIIAFQWDTASDGVDSWVHSDGTKRWRVDKRGYIGDVRKRAVILDRIPEHVHRGNKVYL